MGDHLDLGIGISAAGAQQSEKATRSLLGTLKDYVKGIFSFKGATKEANEEFTNHVSKVSIADDVYERVGGAIRSLRNKLLAFAGVYAASDVFNRAIEEGRELEQLYTRLANRFGNERFAEDITNWIVETTGRLPVAQDEMEEFVKTMDQFAINPQLANLEGVLAASLGPGESLSNVMSQITSLAQSGDAQGFIEAFAGRVSPQEIAESLQGAVTVQERIIALTQLMDQEFSENIDRYKDTVQGYMGALSNIFDLFKRALVGDPEAGTFFGEFRRFVRDFTGWFIERKDEIISFGNELGQFFGRIFRLFRRNFLSLGDFSDRAFATIRTFIRSSRELVNPFILFLAILMEKVKTFFSGFKEGFLDFFGVLEEVIGGIVSGFQQMFEAIFGMGIQDQLSGIQSILETIFNDQMVRDFGNAVGFATGIFATFVGLRWGIAKLSGALSFFTGILSTLGTLLMAHPYVAVIGAIAAAGVALWRAWSENLFGLRDDLDPLFQWLIETFTSVRNTIVDVWGDLTEEVGGFFQDIRPELNAIWDVLRPLAVFLGETLVRMTEFGLKTFWETVKRFFSLVKEIVLDVWDIFKGFVTAVVNLLTGDFAGAWRGIKTMITGLKDLFVDTFSGVVGMLTNMFSNLISTLGERISAIADEWKDVFFGIFQWLGQKVNEYVIGPLNSLAGIIGFQIPEIDVSSGGEDSQRPTSPIEVTPVFNQPRLAPAAADASGKTVNNNRSFNINVTQQPGESPESVARRIYNELKTKERRNDERG